MKFRVFPLIQEEKFFIYLTIPSLYSLSKLYGGDSMSLGPSPFSKVSNNEDLLVLCKIPTSPWRTQYKVIDNPGVSYTDVKTIVLSPPYGRYRTLQ